MPIRKRYQPAIEEAQENLGYDMSLPTHLPVANYYRQSSISQVGNISTAIQTIDMKEYLQNLGWDADDIKMIDMDAGVSGTTKIDERAGMSELFQLITNGEIGAVSCQDEDRLFRDVTQIQVNIFIEACKQNEVFVITPTMVYIFHHTLVGTSHARQFRFKSEMAAEYITTFIKGKLHRAIRRINMSGRWSGSQMPAGYMADIRKELPSGIANPDYHAFHIFEPYAEVAREYWNIFLAKGGQIRPTLRHIEEHGPYYPDPASCPAPEGFKAVYRLNHRNGKWYPTTRTGLRQMFTNAAYIGHWLVKGRVIAWDNHPAIIDEQTFMRAFNYLSEVGLDGSPNPNYAPVIVHARPTKAEERDKPWPLCAGLIHTQVSEEWTVVGVNWNNQLNAYFYQGYCRIAEVARWSKKAIYIDDAVTDAMLMKLRATFDFDAWEQTAQEITKRVEEENKVRKAQLVQLESVMDSLTANLATLQHPQMVKAAEQRYIEAEMEMARLQREIAERQAGSVSVAKVQELRHSCGKIVDEWPITSSDGKREILHSFVHRIEAEHLGRGEVSLTIKWKDGDTSYAFIPAKSSLSRVWTEEAIQYIVKSINTGVDQLEIAKQFPDRKWNAIREVYRKNVRKEDRVKYTGKYSMKKLESYNSYMKRIGREDNIICPFESRLSEGRRSGWMTTPLYVWRSLWTNHRFERVALLAAEGDRHRRQSLP